MSTTDTTTVTPEHELQSLARNIETYRTDAGLSKAVFLREYPELGTDKTYGKIVAGDFAELKIEEKWLPAYRHVWMQIEGDDQVHEVGIIQDLSGPRELCRAFLETRRERGNSRFILVLGDSGVGKSTALQIVKSKPYGQNAIEIEAIEGWKNRQARGSDMALLRALLRKLGVKQPPVSRDEMIQEVVDKLQGKARYLFIDEAHHLCPNGLNMIKSLINLTPVIVVATAMPILWERLSSSRQGWVECKQLTTNRLAEKIHLRLEKADVVRFLTETAPELDTGTIGKAAVALLDDAPRLGNMKFVSAVVKRFKREIAAGQEATIETFINAIAAEKKRR